MKTDISKIFFFKGTDLLIAIKNSRVNERFGLKLSKITKLGYARVNQLLQLFEKMGLIRFTPLNGRTKGIELTKKGEDIVNNLMSAKNKLLQ